MKTKIGIALIVLGLVLISGALGLFAYNSSLEEKAGEASDVIMPQLVEEIQHRQAEAPSQRPLQQLPLDLPEVEARELPVVEIDGHGYIGFLTIPVLNMERPVMADWDDDKLQIAPCRYSGSTYTEDLVIMAHNYWTHFGKLNQLKLGDQVLFTDMDGITTTYEVSARDVLAATAVEEMTAGEYDLTLFTCTYGGKSRITIRCSRIEDAASTEE